MRRSCFVCRTVKQKILTMKRYYIHISRNQPEKETIQVREILNIECTDKIIQSNCHIKSAQNNKCCNLK